MDANDRKACEFVSQAREALQRGDKVTAGKLSRQAVEIDPNLEDAWLVLAASATRPKDAVAYAQKALQMHPDSARARQSLQWAYDWVKQTRVDRGAAGQNLLRYVQVPVRSATPAPPQKTNRNRWLYPVLLAGFVCLLLGVLGLFAMTTPAFASIMRATSLPSSTQEVLWARMEISKPTGPSEAVSEPGSPLQSITATNLPTEEPTLNPTETSDTLVETDAIPTEPSGTFVEATATPGTMTMEIVDEDYVSQAVPQEDISVQYPAQGNGERWIDVNLSEQRVYAYEGDVIVNSFLVSTGLPDTPTVTGDYQIYVKVPIQDMSGPGYYLSDVPWVMYFYDEYGFHGTYWHNNFGRPMSRGCVNMTIAEAKWLFNWASVGTKVSIHY